ELLKHSPTAKSNVENLNLASGFQSGRSLANRRGRNYCEDSRYFAEPGSLVRGVWRLGWSAVQHHMQSDPERELLCGVDRSRQKQVRRPAPEPRAQRKSDRPQSICGF